MELGTTDFEVCDGWGLLLLLGFYLWGIKQANRMIATKNGEDAEAQLAGAGDPNPAVTPNL
jgi:hypothetical protein